MIYRGFSVPRGLGSLAIDNQTIKEVMGFFFPAAKPFWFT